MSSLLVSEQCKLKPQETLFSHLTKNKTKGKKRKNPDNTIHRQGDRPSRTLRHQRQENETVGLSWRPIWQFVITLNAHLPCDPASPFLLIYLKEILKNIFKNNEQAHQQNIKRNELLIYMATRMNLKNRLSERSQAQKAKNMI